jgi:phage terminase large subunit-like protein
MCRRDLEPFFAYTNGWSVPYHQSVALPFIRKAIDTPDSRSILTMPPRVGKTESVLSAVTQALGRGVAGLGDVTRVGYVCHTAPLASSLTATIRDRFASARSRTRRVFPEAVLRTASEAEGEWNFYGYDRHIPNAKAAGIGGGIIGYGFDLLVVDDPFKTPEQAASTTYREKVWNWWNAVPMTRLLPGGRIIVVSTRWHSGDLTGRLLRQGGWTELRLKMLDEANASGRAEWWRRTHGRERDPFAGSRALVPTFDNEKPAYPDRWCEARAARADLVWNAHYQGQPVGSDGELVKRKWLTDNLYNGKAPDCRVIVTAWDCADKPEDLSDWTAWVQVARDRDGFLWVLDFGRGKWDHPARVKQVEAGRPGWATTMQSGPASRRDEVAIIEDARGGTSVIQSVRRNRRRGVIPLEPKGMSKGVRMSLSLPQVEAGLVRLPAHHPFLDEFLNEVCAFPRGENDDLFDAFAWACLYLFGHVRDTRPVIGAPGDEAVALSVYRDL